MIATRKQGYVFRKYPRAFSLIELLLVLVILATLAAVIVPKFSNRSKQARLTAAQTDVSSLETALDAFEVDCGRYPTEAEGFEALYEEPSDVKNWRGPYFKRGIPKDPWGNPYVYKQPGEHNTSGYDVYSLGPNGQGGDEDDICNWNKED